jgi:hypothetical protein
MQNAAFSIVYVICSMLFVHLSMSSNSAAGFGEGTLIAGYAFAQANWEKHGSISRVVGVRYPNKYFLLSNRYCMNSKQFTDQRWLIY